MCADNPAKTSLEDESFAPDAILAETKLCKFVVVLRHFQLRRAERRAEQRVQALQQ